MKSYLAEAIGTFALIFVGIGAIHNASSDLLLIALAHGLTIAVMVSATGAISGGHLNPAVTLALWVGKKITPLEAGKYWIAQLLGATLAALAARYLFGGSFEVMKGTPTLRVSWMDGVLIEAILTFFLVFVVYGTAADPRGPKIGGLAIGLTVALDIMVGGPLTGAAMNPARAFGPALVTGEAYHNFTTHLVYWIGPCLGGSLAGYVYSRYLQD
ncbi:MAG: aquaporin [Verrucomicrobiota bacterium]